jgi:hypothetical protein
MTTLNTIIRGFRGAYFAFDGLDEYPDRSRLLTFLKQIRDWEVDTLHVLTTSRKERDIEEILGGLVSHEMPMDESSVDKEILEYVSRTLDEDIKLSRCFADKKEMVKTTLMKGAHGM